MSALLIEWFVTFAAAAVMALCYLKVYRLNVRLRLRLEQMIILVDKERRVAAEGLADTRRAYQEVSTDAILASIVEDLAARAAQYAQLGGVEDDSSQAFAGAADIVGRYRIGSIIKDVPELPPVREAEL